MPERSVVRELVTVLGFEVDEAKIGRYEKAIRVVKQRVRAATIATGVFTGAVAFVTRQIAKEGEEIFRTAQRLKMSSDALQEWRFAAKSSNVAVATFNASLDSFSRRVGLASRGTGPAVEALARLRIQVRESNGEIKDMDELLLETFHALEGFEEGFKRNQLAADLFNMSGQAMNQMLANGVDGLMKMRQRAHELGGVMTKDLTEQSVKTVQAWTDFMFIIKGVRNVLAIELLPAMSKTLQSWGSWIKDNKELIALLGKVLLGVLALRIPMALLGAKMSIVLAGVGALLLLAQDVALALSDPKAKTVVSDIVEKGPQAFGILIDKIKKWITDLAIAYLPDKVIEGLRKVRDWIFELLDSIAAFLGEKLGLNWIRQLAEQETAPPLIETLGPAARAFAAMETITPKQTVNFTINQSPGQTPEAVAAAMATKLQIEQAEFNINMLRRFKP